MASLADLVQYADDYLRVGEIEDWANALNGLQIQNSGSVTKIGAAVDVSTRVLNEAAKRNVDLLLVHHGLFWPGLQTVTGALHRQLKLAMEKNIALYSAHLPLDIHPEVGNNAQLAKALGLKSTLPFFEEKGSLVGVKAKSSQPREDLIRKVRKVLGGPVKVFNFGPKKANSVGIITGGAGSEIYKVAQDPPSPGYGEASKIDTFITGEAPHWAAVAAEELGINLVLGGHYATETFGVKALAAHLSKKFRVPFEFIDCPTGL
jgi:dinuclear metal center YbgI/SA1388 family protein